MIVLAPLAFGPVYVVLIAALIGAGVVVLLGRSPRVTEPEDPRPGRGAADHPLIRKVDSSLEEKAVFLVKLGFTDVEYLVEESTQGVVVFRARSMTPLSGGTFLVQFLCAKHFRGIVASPEILSFRTVVKHEEGVLKGILVTSGAFSQAAVNVIEKAPVELIDGQHMLSLLKLFYPEQFPKERI